MTTELDPIRWTESSDDAPELLRAPFAAATREGPSAAQMRMLALKLSAVAAGTAVAAASSTVQASATASSTLTGSAAASSALPFAKLVAAAVVVGATALGGVALFGQQAAPDSKAPAVQTSTKSVPANVTSARSQKANGDVGGPLEQPERQPVIEAQEAPVIEAQEAPVVEAQAPLGERAVTPKDIARPSREESATLGADPARSAKVAPTQKEAAGSVAAQREAHERQAAVPSEVELLRRARSALASRPREAFVLTEQHREHYARGVFAQERDALAIEALLRSGDTEAARDLAKRFVSAHPSSPHAHRFRETLGL